MRYLLFVLLCCQVALTSPTTITYSSLVTDVNKKPRAISDFITFRLFDDSVGGTKLWEEELKVVAPNGLVSAVLGAKTNFPIRQVTGSNKLFLEMQIGSESPFSRQKISNSFFAFGSAYSDSARHSLLADSAKMAGRALAADTANTAKAALALEGQAASEYVLQTHLNSLIPDSSKNARNSDSLGKFPAAAFAKKVDKIDSARVAQRADSLGAFFAGLYALKSGKIDSARLAQRADSLGTFPATRYVKADPSGNVGIGTNPSSKLHVLGTTILSGQTSVDSGFVLNSGRMDLTKAVLVPKFATTSSAGMPTPAEGEALLWLASDDNKMWLIYMYSGVRYHVQLLGGW